MYPKEWDELKYNKVPKRSIDGYLLNFVAKILKEVKAGTRNHMDLGDGFSIGVVHGEGNGYKLNPALRDFLMKLSDYNLEFEDGSKGGDFETPEEVEIELRKLAKKLEIKLNL